MEENEMNVDEYSDLIDWTYELLKDGNKHEDN